MTLFISECGRKKHYSSFELADKVRKKCEELRGGKLRIYNCRYCQNFHLTSMGHYPNQNAEQR